MTPQQQEKQGRYDRLKEQLRTILAKCGDEEARMASVTALLHHKMRNFFWTGFYGLKDGRLIVKLYQGPVACMELKKDTGVCWAVVNSGRPIVVPDVEQFPGHIACDSRSRSEICIPFLNKAGVLIAVLDIDSDVLGNFDAVDERELQAVLSLINDVPCRV
jgi:GAF domain-containing protein